ncbi:hypothetical protein GCM10011324_23520 [Allosediminivita pacifica]|nr:hypothetical protein GCM10011324_23520 [Allosediminivita pacifica]
MQDLIVTEAEQVEAQVGAALLLHPRDSGIATEPRGSFAPDAIKDIAPGFERESTAERVGKGMKRFCGQFRHGGALCDG